jgi:hypothetical protein
VPLVPRRPPYIPVESPSALSRDPVDPHGIPWRLSAAPSGGFAVDLTSDNTTAATVPPSITVPAGSASATFTVSTKVVTNAQSATIIGTVGGDFATERHAVITVWDPFHFANGSIAIRNSLQACDSRRVLGGSLAPRRPQ